MIIILNKDLKEQNFNRYNVKSSFDVYSNIERKGNRLKLIKWHQHNDSGLGFLELLSRCYKFHNPMSIKPDDIWFIIQNELTKIINKNPENFRKYFSENENKVEILIPTNDVENINIFSLMESLSNRLKFDYNNWCIEFSTSDLTSLMCQFATLAESASNYYNYSTFLCGLPKIKILGTDEDWNKILTSVDKLKNVFIDTEIEIYLNKIYELVKNICKNRNVDFWKNIFTQKNIGSGGDLIIDGWILDLFYESEKIKLKKLENFLFTYATIPYKNIDTGRKFKSIYGAFNFKQDYEGFYVTQYDYAIFEILK